MFMLWCYLLVIVLIIYNLYFHFGIQLQQYADNTQLHIPQSHTAQPGGLKLQGYLSSMYRYVWFWFNGQAIKPAMPSIALIMLIRFLLVSLT